MAWKLRRVIILKYMTGSCGAVILTCEGRKAERKLGPLPGAPANDRNHAAGGGALNLNAGRRGEFELL